MRQREEYQLAKQYVIDHGITVGQIEKASTQQIRNVLSGIGIEDWNDNMIQTLKGALLADFKNEDLKAKRKFVIDALRVRWPDIVIERGDCREKPMFEIWPLGKPEEPII